MYERFTDRARLVMVLAKDEAKAYDHNYIGTEHLLLGLIREGEGIATLVLESFGISTTAVRGQVEEIIGRGDQAPGGHIPFTPRAKKVLDLSIREALQIGHNYVGTEHLLLALIREGEGVAAQVLVKLGAELEPTRQRVIQALSGHPEFVVAPPVERLIRPYAVELTSGTRTDPHPPVVSRDRLLERTMLVLARAGGNAAVLVGEPGAGRTTLLHGLAQLVQSGRAPDVLRGHKVYAVRRDTLPADGAQAAAALQAVHDALTAPNTRRAQGLILAFDDVERIVDVMPGSGLLYLRRLAAVERHRIVLTTTPQAHRDRLAELGAQFVPVPVERLSPLETIQVLRTLVGSYEQRHSMRVEEAALYSVVGLPGRDRPGAALEVLEEAAQLLRMRRGEPPAELRQVTARLATARRDRELAVAAENLQAVAQLHDQEASLLREQALLQQQWREADPDGFVITPATIGELIRIMADQPAAPGRAAPPAVSAMAAAVPATAADPAPPAATITAVARPDSPPPRPAEPVVLPVREESVAVLLGASRFPRDPHLGDVPAVSRNLMDLSTALSEPGGVFDPRRVHAFDQLEHHDLARVDELAQEATDTLLVYYAGHGVNAADDLYLAYSSTISARPRISALAFDQVRHIVLSSPARRCVIILDCCYAGKAIGWLSGDGTPGGELDVRGTYLLTATAASVKALAPADERNTAFTAAILRLLREGIDDAGDYIRVADLYPRLRADLRSRALPLPQQRRIDTIAHLALAANPRRRAAA
ncbi:Clp protease N-terminal domain-containing protein [Catellatospora sp. NPDC049609]|uniref:caspase, EACC1-associated type n=1 Tax=Catellatospora sp. NPDC049609 TaxID=3155505 RepID=UPI00341C2689